jgi:hypothetical protein
MTTPMIASPDTATIIVEMNHLSWVTKRRGPSSLRYIEGCLRPPFDTARVCWTRTRSVPRRRESPRSVRSSKLKSPSAPIGARFCAAVWAKMRRRDRDCAYLRERCAPNAVKSTLRQSPLSKNFPQIEKISVGAKIFTLRSRF